MADGLQTYVSHKRVQAAPITRLDIDDGGVVRHVDAGGETIAVPKGFDARGRPQEGDYLVRYEPDGYLSWSPKAVFEDGYTLEEGGR